MVQFLVKQTLCSSFILIYFTVNSYIVNKVRSLWRLSLQKMDITKEGDRGPWKTRGHGSLSHKTEVFAPGKPLGSRGPEVEATSSSHSAENPPVGS